MNPALLDRQELMDFIANGLQRSAFDFFKKQLREICAGELAKPNPQFNGEQIDYIAGLLTAFSKTSADMGTWPLPVAQSEELRSLEKRFAVPYLRLPPWRYERLARSLLFMASFEEKFVKRYYTEYAIILIGEQLFLRAAVEPRTDLLLGVSKNFGTWLNYLRALKYKLVRGYI